MFFFEQKYFFSSQNLFTLMKISLLNGNKTKGKVI